MVISYNQCPISIDSLILNFFHLGEILVLEVKLYILIGF